MSALWRPDTALPVPEGGLVTFDGFAYRARLRITYALPECEPVANACGWFDLVGVCD